MLPSFGSLPGGMEAKSQREVFKSVPALGPLVPVSKVYGFCPLPLCSLGVPSINTSVQALGEKWLKEEKTVIEDMIHTFVYSSIY